MFKKKYAVMLQVTNDQGEFLRENLVQKYWFYVNAKNSANDLNAMWRCLDSIHHLSFGNQYYFVDTARAALKKQKKET